MLFLLKSRKEGKEKVSIYSVYCFFLRKENGEDE
ncbi:hypothetical protein P301_L20826 [Saccharomyces cerevisiae P301]|uniref:EC1118_1L10_2036p n=1 Tax=Saccharomyces cerevisiae (strain Lalvin EC1118 / Prise de mousse) TaxID=643680 RepID=C8ZD90_YEAS8|nr:hypothetical protein P301_L20826 [Saccharomyces cerevisiae P301]EWG94723.1 hypothetical protein R103_L21056 [Saccharomyces cerevisiae R103]CAY81356.1 EC1118_1L10_2036p [Saccharomyces cerevisiae EC1118]